MRRSKAAQDGHTHFDMKGSCTKIVGIFYNTQLPVAPQVVF